MSDEYSVHTNFQRSSDDPRAAAEYAHRMQRVHEAEAELLSLQRAAAERTRRTATRAVELLAAEEAEAQARRSTMHVVEP